MRRGIPPLPSRSFISSLKQRIKLLSLNRREERLSQSLRRRAWLIIEKDVCISKKWSQMFQTVTRLICQNAGLRFGGPFFSYIPLDATRLTWLMIDPSYRLDGASASNDRPHEFPVPVSGIV